jgi:hypothetical protein
MTDLSVPKADGPRQEESTENSEVSGPSLVNDQLPVKRALSIRETSRSPRTSGSDIAEPDLRSDTPKTATAIIQDVTMETIVGNAIEPHPSEESGSIPSESDPPPGESAPDATPQSESENVEPLPQSDSENSEPLPEVLRSEIILNPSTPKTASHNSIRICESRSPRNRCRRGEL